MPTTQRRLIVLVVIVAALSAGIVALWPEDDMGVDPARIVPARPAVPVDPDPDPEAAPALAEWLAAPPDPLVVGAPALARRRERENVSSSGAILELVADRQRFTLFVPPGAVVLDAEVALTAVAELPGLPFADRDARAVRIELPRALRLPATLTIAPAREDDTAGHSGTAFLVDLDSRELHLVPSASRAPGRQLLVDRSGVYGIANAAEAERRNVSDHVPTDPRARLDMIVAQVREDAPDATAGVDWAGWLPVATAHAQEAGDEAHLDEVELRAVKALREYYDQKLMPRIGQLGRGCSAKDREFLMVFNEEARGWLQSAEFIGFLYADKPRVELDPAVEPYQYHARAGRRAHFQKLQAEFAAKEEALRRGLRDGDLRMYAAVKACCLKRPEQWMPAYLAGMQRAAGFSGVADTMAPDGKSDLRDCICAVDAVVLGKGWTGSISQTDTNSAEVRSAKGGGLTTTTVRRRYSVEVSLLGGDQSGSALGLAVSTGESSFATHRVAEACPVDERTSLREIANAHGTAFGKVHMSVRNDGSYTITFPHPLAIGLERRESQSRREGCRNPFGNFADSDSSVRSGKVTTDNALVIQGHTEVPTRLAGALTLRLPDTHFERNRQATVEWNVQACAAN